MAWPRKSYTDPQAFGARGNGENDQAALSAFIAAQLEMQTGTDRDMTACVLDFGGRTYSISETLDFPVAHNLIIKNLSLRMIGSDWTSDDFGVTMRCPHSVVENLWIDCNKVGNGVSDQATNINWHGLKVAQMTPNWASKGFEKLDNTGNTGNLFNPQIRQWTPSRNPTEWADPEKFTADCVRLFQSDFMIWQGNLGCARTAFVGGNGVYVVSGTHFWNGHAINNPILVEFGEADGGNLTLDNIYADGGIFEIYGSVVQATGKILIKPEQATITDGLFRFHRRDRTELQFTADLTVIAKGDGWDFIRLVDDEEGTWSAGQNQMVSDLNAAIAADTNPQGQHLIVSNRLFQAVSNASSSGIVHFAPPNVYESFEYMTGGVKFPQVDDEPIHVQNGFIAYSTGVLSTNGFGADGAGPYEKSGNVWNILRPRGANLTINNGGVGVFNPIRDGGFLSITCEGQADSTEPLPGFSGEIWFDIGSTPSGVKNTGWSGVSANLDIVTTNVSGTTGTVGKVTVAVIAGMIKIENRSGTTKNFKLAVR